MALQSPLYPQRTRIQLAQDARSSLSPCVRMAWLRPCTGVGARAHTPGAGGPACLLFHPPPGSFETP